MTIEQKLEAFLRSDRQWFRDQRIAHAKYQIRHCEAADREFWHAVLYANLLPNEVKKHERQLGALQNLAAFQ